MFPYMYSDYTNTVDLHTIIIISMFFICISYVFYTDRFVFSAFDSHS
jgi:hypothetical protein